MEITALWKGYVLGFAMAIPIGPIGLLCIRRTLARSPLHGFMTGMGAAVADTFYGVVAAFGITLVSDFLLAQQEWTKLVGGLFLIFIGARIFLTKPPDSKEETKKSSLWRSFLSSLLLTLTNPATVLSFVAVFAGFGLVHVVETPIAATLLVTGIFFGSATWWFFLSGSTSLMRHKISNKTMLSINRLSGGIIIAFALWALASFLKDYFTSSY